MFSCTLVLLVTGLTCVWTQTTLEEKKSVNKVLTAGTHGKQGKISISVPILIFSKKKKSLVTIQIHLSKERLV